MSRKSGKRCNTQSKPWSRRTDLPSGKRQRILMRFLSLLNSNTASTSSFTCCPCTSNTTCYQSTSYCQLPGNVTSCLSSSKSRTTYDNTVSHHVTRIKFRSQGCEVNTMCCPSQTCSEHNSEWVQIAAQSAWLYGQCSHLKLLGITMWVSCNKWCVACSHWCCLC